MDDIDGLDALDSEAKALEATLGSVTALTDRHTDRYRGAVMSLILRQSTVDVTSSDRILAVPRIESDGTDRPRRRR